MFVELLLAVAAVSPVSDTARMEVVCAETGFSRAAEAKDKAAFLSFVHPDARFVTGQVARGRDQIGEAWGAALADDGPTMRWRPAYVEVSADGQMALSRGPYRSTSVTEDGEIRHSWGHFISTWRRDDDGDWLVMFDSGGDAGMEPTPQEVEILESEPECP